MPADTPRAPAPFRAAVTGLCLALMPGLAPAQTFGISQMTVTDRFGLANGAAQPGSGLATPSTGPIGAIDWLDALNRAGISAPAASGDAGDVADSALAPEVRTLTLSASDAGAVGLLPASVTGLPTTLWQGSDSATLIQRISALDVSGLPAMQALLYTLLLAEADPPESADTEEDDPLLLARIDKLTDLGALDPALALIERAGQTRTPALFSDWLDLSLLAGLETQPCRRIASDPEIAPSQSARIFCLARNRDWQTAALLLETASAIGTLEPVDEQLLTRFLHVDLDDTAAPLPPPSEITPLRFRLSEAIGEPLPTTDLPRAYAYYDLRGRAGWKASLEAAERLSRSGALPENRLLGLYSGGQPSASGGIWDRVAAVQAFDAAIGAPRPVTRQVIDTLPPAWEAMRDAGLETAFAALYGARLLPYASGTGPAAHIALQAVLLSPEATELAETLTARTPTDIFLVALARGEPGSVEAPSNRARIVAQGFSSEEQLPERLQDLIHQGRLGEAILGAMQLYTYAMSGDLKDSAPALATFRAIGLEDTARAAALQIFLLDDRG